MIQLQRKNIFFLGVFIFLIPYLGLPAGWKTFFIVLSGLTLITLSIKITLPKKGAVKRPRKKEKVTPVFVENSPIFPKPENRTQSVSDFSGRAIEATPAVLPSTETNE